MVVLQSALLTHSDVALVQEDQAFLPEGATQQDAVLWARPFLKLLLLGGERGGGLISQLLWPLGLLWKRRTLLEVGVVALVGTSEEGCLRFRAEWAR